jgi:hypothetical protein
MAQECWATHGYWPLSDEKEYDMGSLKKSEE